MGGTLLRNLISTPFGGTVSPVNPKRSSVLGLVEECIGAGVPTVVVLSAGFREIGAAGAAIGTSAEFMTPPFQPKPA